VTRHRAELGVASRLLTTVLKKCPDLIMCSTEMKHQAFTLSLKNQAQIQATPALHKRDDSPQSHPGMQMRNAIGQSRSLHGGQDFCPTFVWDAF
jgi:hypothetical protein